MTSTQICFSKTGQEKPCVVDPPWELSTGIISLTWLETWIALPGFVLTGLAPWQQQFSQFQLNLKMTISLYTDADGKLQQKWLCCGNCLEGSLRATSSPVRWTSCTNFVFFLKRTMIIPKLRGSSACGCLPRYVAYSSCVTQTFIQWWWKQLYVSWEWANNSPEKRWHKHATPTTYHP